LGIIPNNRPFDSIAMVLYRLFAAWL